MHHTAIDYGPRYLGTAVLILLIILLTVICLKKFRRSRHPWLIAVLCGYDILLLALFIFALLADDGYGWVFVPLLFATAPWCLVASFLGRGLLGQFFASGLFGTFVLLVVICGGINNFLLYTVIRKTFYPSDSPVKRSLL